MAHKQTKIKVLVVDDSAIVREKLAGYLRSLPDMEVVGTAPDPYIARDKVLLLKPDVLTLDIEMPKMDGLSFLEKLMIYHPLPVIIVSSVTARDPSAILRALELGAYDVVNKSSMFQVEDVLEEIAFKIRAAYENKETFLRRFPSYRDIKKIPVTALYLKDIISTDMIIGIGASTGGTIALEFLLRQLPKHFPPVLIVQHMPPVFTRQFAAHLNGISQLEVREAGDGDTLQSGFVYVAPGGKHMEVRKQGTVAHIVLTDGPKVHFQKPSVDVLFFSLASTFGKNTVAVLLTGMGKDGAAGLLEIKNKGGYTIIQDESTSIVWGMPKAAMDIHAHREVLPLQKIPERLVELVKSRVS